MTAVKSIRTISKVVAGLWLVGVIVIGIGGTSATHNQEEIALAAAGTSREELQEMRDAREAKRAEKQARREARNHAGSGWGSDDVAAPELADDWGAP